MTNVDINELNLKQDILGLFIEADVAGRRAFAANADEVTDILREGNSLYMNATSRLQFKWLVEAALESLVLDCDELAVIVSSRKDIT